MKKQSCPMPECPKEGDKFVCEECGFAVTVTTACECEDCTCVSLACCGACMKKE